jgi:hypothetical protein
LFRKIRKLELIQHVADLPDVRNNKRVYIVSDTSIVVKNKGKVLLQECGYTTSLLGPKTRRGRDLVLYKTLIKPLPQTGKCFGQEGQTFVKES